MDCQHEIDLDIEFIGSHYVLGYKCEKCSGEWSEDEVVILTKAQHDKMVAVFNPIKNQDYHMMRQKATQLKQTDGESWAIGKMVELALDALQESE